MSSDQERLFSAAFIHEKIGIPYKYLTMLMTKLAKAELLTVTRGRNGGFTLIRDVDQIFLVDILDAIGENTCKNCAFSENECDINNPCALHEHYKHPKEEFEKMLTTTTLAKIDASLLAKQ